MEEYNYDYVYRNDKILSEAKSDFLRFLDRILRDK